MRGRCLDRDRAVDTTFEQLEVSPPVPEPTSSSIPSTARVSTSMYGGDEPSVPAPSCGNSPNREGRSSRRNVRQRRCTGRAACAHEITFIVNAASERRHLRRPLRIRWLLGPWTFPENNRTALHDDIVEAEMSEKRDKLYSVRAPAIQPVQRSILRRIDCDTSLATTQVVRRTNVSSRRTPTITPDPKVMTATIHIALFNPRPSAVNPASTAPTAYPRSRHNR